MEVLTEMDEYFNAMQKINMDEPVMPYVKGRLVESATYNKLRKIMETPELEKAHPYCYDLDPEQLEDCDVAKINNLYKLGVDRGFIEDDFQYQDPEDAECCDRTCQDELTEPAEEAPAPVNPRAKIPCFVAMYSAMKDGQIKTGEAYSRAISVQAAKADVIAQLSRFGYSNISILAIEATEEDACGCTLNEGNLGKYVGAGLGAFGGAAMGAGLGSNFGSDVATGVGGVTGAIGGGWLGSKIGDEAGENVDVDADVKFGKNARSSGPQKRRTKSTSESEDEEASAEENAGKKEDKSEEPAEEPAEEPSTKEKPKKKAKKSKKEPAEEPAEEPVEEAPAEEEPADDGADDMFGLAGDEGSTNGGEADNQTDDSNIEADTGNDAETTDANQEENSDDTQEEVPASNDEQPANEPAEEAPAEEEPAEEENDKEEELDPNKKAELKDNYKKIFKNTMLKCKFEDRSFDDLSLKEKVKFFTELSKTWKEEYEPQAFMTDKEIDQLEKTVVKKQ